MSLYLEQIRQLVALQHVDDGIHAVHAELEAAPKEVEALEKRFLAQDSQRNWILEKVQHLQEQQKRLDADIEDDESRLANSKNKLNLFHFSNLYSFADKIKLGVRLNTTHFNNRNACFGKRFYYTVVKSAFFDAVLTVLHHDFFKAIAFYKLPYLIFFSLAENNFGWRIINKITHCKPSF